MAITPRLYKSDVKQRCHLGQAKRKAWLYRGIGGVKLPFVLLEERQVQQSVLVNIIKKPEDGKQWRNFGFGLATLRLHAFDSSDDSIAEGDTASGSSRG